MSGRTALEASRWELPNITARCVRLIADGADPAVLAGELGRVLGELGCAPWTPERVVELAAGLAEGAS